jgi:hypothetical protein
MPPNKGIVAEFQALSETTTAGFADRLLDNSQSQANVLVRKPLDDTDAWQSISFS